MSVTWTWNITKDLFHSGVSVWLCRKSLSPRFARGISGGWVALCILGVRTWRKYSEAINHLSCPSKNTLFCEGHNRVSFRVKIMISADLRGWGTREGFPPAPSFPLLFSPPYDFPLLHPLEKEQVKPWLFFLTLSINSDQKSLFMIFPYTTEANCLELLPPQAIPASLGTAPNHYSSIFCENEANCLLILLPQR